MCVCERERERESVCVTVDECVLFFLVVLTHSFTVLNGTLHVHVRVCVQ